MKKIFLFLLSMIVAYNSAFTMQNSANSSNNTVESKVIPGLVTLPQDVIREIFIFAFEDAKNFLDLAAESKLFRVMIIGDSKNTGCLGFGFGDGKKETGLKITVNATNNDETKFINFCNGTPRICELSIKQNLDMNKYKKIVTSLKHVKTLIINGKDNFVNICNPKTKKCEELAISMKLDFDSDENEFEKKRTANSINAVEKHFFLNTKNKLAIIIFNSKEESGIFERGKPTDVYTISDNTKSEEEIIKLKSIMEKLFPQLKWKKKK